MARAIPPARIALQGGGPRESLLTIAINPTDTTLYPEATKIPEKNCTPTEINMPNRHFHINFNTGHVLSPFNHKVGVSRLQRSSWRSGEGPGSFPFLGGGSSGKMKMIIKPQESTSAIAGQSVLGISFFISEADSRFSTSTSRSH